MHVVLQLAMGKMMDQGPVLIITFQAQLVMVIRNTKGEVVEGDPVSLSHTHTHTELLVDRELLQSFSWHVVTLTRVWDLLNWSLSECNETVESYSAVWPLFIQTQKALWAVNQPPRTARGRVCLEARSKYPFSTVQLADAQCSGYKASAKG